MNKVLSSQANIMRSYIAKFLIEDINKDAIIKSFRNHFAFRGKLSVSDDGTVNVSNCFKRQRILFSRLPVRFGLVSGDFSCISAGLTSLDGCPISVGRNFVCTDNILENLIGCPTTIGDNLVCVICRLKSLEGCPEVIPGEFACSRNELVSLEHGPKQVGGNFDCSVNPLRSLEYLPSTVGGYIKVTWSKNLPLLRLVRYSNVYLINKNERLMRHELPQQILSKYCGVQSTRGDIIACQKELIDGGFEGNASW